MGIMPHTSPFLSLAQTPLQQAPPGFQPHQDIATSNSWKESNSGKDLSKLFMPSDDSVSSNLDSPGSSQIAVQNALNNLSLNGKGRGKRCFKSAASVPAGGRGALQRVLDLPESQDWSNPPEGWCKAVERTYQNVVPDHKEQQRRQQVLDEIRAAVESCKKGNPPCRLEVYGSFVSGMWTLHSDLDLTVLPTVAADSKGWSTDTARSCINRFHQTLKRKGLTSFELSELRLRARVPIAVFEHRGSRVSCDLSFNNTAGIFKAHFLHGLKRVDPRFCQLYMLVKAWARAQGLNDSSEGTFNSWCLAMLVIFYLQTKQTPAILPPIRELFDRREDAQELGQHPDNFTLLSRHRDLVDKHIGYGTQNTTPLGQLFLGFLDCMGVLVDTWLSTQGQPAQGRVNVWDAVFCSGLWAKEYRASVEDPFDPSDNCARTITNDGLPMLKQAMAATKQALQHLRSTGNVDTTLSMLFIKRPTPPREMGTTLQDIFGSPASTSKLPPSPFPAHTPLHNPGAAILAALTGLGRQPTALHLSPPPPPAHPMFGNDHHPLSLGTPAAQPPQPPSFLQWEKLPNPDIMTPSRHPPLPPTAMTLEELEARQLEQEMHNIMAQQQQKQDAENAVRMAVAAGFPPPGFAPNHFQTSPMPRGWPPNGFTPQYNIVMNNS